MPEIQDLLVNAPLAHQRKLVDGVDRSTTHRRQNQPPSGSLRQPNRPNAFLKRATWTASRDPQIGVSNGD